MRGVCVVSCVFRVQFCSIKNSVVCGERMLRRLHFDKFRRVRVQEVQREQVQETQNVPLLLHGAQLGGVGKGETRQDVFARFLVVRTRRLEFESGKLVDTQALEGPLD